MQGPRLAIAFLLFVHTVFGATSYWRNTSAGLFSTGANWVGGVPGSADTAVFTNATSLSVQWSSAATTANASFRGTGTVTQDIQTASWTVRTNYSVGDISNADATVVLSSGTLNVTNQAHTAQMVIGGAGKGTFALQGGTLNVDSLVCTNGTNSLFQFDYGTFTSRGMDLTGSEGRWVVGTTSNQVTKWLIEGTNALMAAEIYGYWLNVGLGAAPGAQVTAIVDGTNSSLQVNGDLLLGWESDAPSELVITNGASADMSILTWGGSSLATNSSGHRVVVTGPSSQLNAALDFSADDSSLLVSNGAAVYTTFLSMLGNSDSILVIGTNSALYLGGSGSLQGLNGQICISKGAALNGHELQISGQDSQLRVEGGDVDLWNLGISGSLLALDQGAVSVGGSFYLADSAFLDFRAGLLNLPGWAVVESPGPLWVGGDPNGAALKLSGSPNDFYCQLVLGSNALLAISGNVFTEFLSVTNGPSDSVIFSQGTWCTTGTQIQMGRPMEVGDGTNAALLRFSGGTHAFGDGLRIRQGSAATGTGSIVGNINFEAQSEWWCDLTGRVTQPVQPLFEVVGNLNVHGVILLTNVHAFVPVRYVLASYTGALDMTGGTLIGVPNAFAAELDTSVPGELAVNVRFIGPLPPNSIGNVVVVGHSTSLSFDTINSATYRVEYSDWLLPATWLPLVELPGTSSIISVIDTNAVTNQRFYRLRTSY